jgi:hypothetical protein
VWYKNSLVFHLNKWIMRYYNTVSNLGNQ